MAKLDPEHPDEARQAQDVDIPPILLLPESQNRTGRGKLPVCTVSSRHVADDIPGSIANVYTPSNEEVEKARLHNERVRRESFNRKDASLKRRALGAVEKAK